MRDIVVIGGGLSGVCAILESFKKVKNVLLIKGGTGATALSSSAFDIVGDNLGKIIPNYEGKFNIKDNIEFLCQKYKFHPYKILGKNNEELLNQIYSNLENFFEILEDVGISYIGTYQYSEILTSLGTFKKTSYFPKNVASSKIFYEKDNRILFLGIKNLKSYNRLLNFSFPKLPQEHIEYEELSLNDLKEKDLTEIEIGRLIDNDNFFDNFLEEVFSILKRKKEITHIIFPPIIGLDKSFLRINQLYEKLGITCLELLGSYNSIHGLRLQKALDKIIKEKNIEYKIGKVTHFTSENGKIKSVTCKINENFEEEIEGKVFILSTGKFIGGGINPRTLKESIFNLPLFYEDEKIEISNISNLINNSLGEKQKIFSIGVKFDNDLRILNEKDIPIYSNLLGCGSILRGYDYIYDKTGLPLALFTGKIAGKNALELI